MPNNRKFIVKSQYTNIICYDYKSFDNHNYYTSKTSNKIMYAVFLQLYNIYTDSTKSTQFKNKDKDKSSDRKNS